MWFSRIARNLRLSRVSYKRCRNTNLVKQMRLRMRRVKSFAYLTKIVVEAIGATVADSTDGYDLAVVTCNAPVNV